MKILAIETSCDETAIALLEITGGVEKPSIKVLANSLLSQMHLHAEYGGVYPNLAKREHIKNLPILLEKTLKEAGESMEAPQIDCLAVTVGPGLEPALWTGITFAQELGKKWGKPVLPVNHMEGHVYSVLYGSNPTELTLPALALLVSGGHTELVYIPNFGQYEVIGRTLDDAVGEAFDKVARMLNLPYPGGPQISKIAHEARESGLIPSFKLPRPMLHSGDLNFSFSGLKTAVLYKIKTLNLEDKGVVEEVALAFEDAAIEVLVEKTRTALEKRPEVKTLIIGGGVSANTYLKSSFHKLMDEFPGVSLELPSRELSTDNAIMIGIAAFVRVTLDPEVIHRSPTLIAKGNLSISAPL